MNLAGSVLIEYVALDRNRSFKALEGYPASDIHLLFRFARRQPSRLSDRWEFR